MTEELPHVEPFDYYKDVKIEDENDTKDEETKKKEELLKKIKVITEVKQVGRLPKSADDSQKEQAQTQEIPCEKCAESKENTSENPSTKTCEHNK